MGNRRSRPRKTCPEKKIVRRIRLKPNAHWWGDCFFCGIRTMVELKADNRTRFCCRACIRKHCKEYKVHNPHLFICQRIHLY